MENTPDQQIVSGAPARDLMVNRSSNAAPKKPNVATPSSAYLRMAPRWRMIETLLGGTEAMRLAERDYLPQHENENNKNYENRLERATLLNMTEQILGHLAGKPFEEQVVLGEDVPEAIVVQAEDIDLQGSNLHAFCRSWFRDGWAKGVSHVLVEHPTPTETLDENGQPRPRTLEDDRAEGLRPFWIHVKPESVIAMYSMVVNGKEVLTHVRIREETVERDGWGEAVKCRIRVLEPGNWQVWKPGPKDNWDEATVESEGTTPLGYIPLVTFYSAKREGAMECKPPLTDVAYLNVAHWQSSSDQRNVLTVSRFPLLAASGVDGDTKVTIGPNSYLTTPDPQGKWYYVEHTGAAIAAGEKDLESLERQMASYGAEFLKKRPGDETATARALDSSESSSYLSATVQDFTDCVELALQFHADWIGAESGGTVQIKTDLDALEADQVVLDILQKTRAQRDISREAYLQHLQARGVLDEDYDAAADGELIADEAKTNMDMFSQGMGTGLPGMDGMDPPEPAEEDPEETEE
jgi:hypothetical protein